MADNSAQQAIQKAKEGIASISAELLLLDKKITETGAKALEMSKKFGAKTPGDMTKQINAQIDAIKKLDAATTSSQKAREAQIMKESNLRENLRKQRNKEEQDNFKNAQRATQASEKMIAAKAKEAASQQKLSGAYAKLNAQMNAQKTVLKDTIVQFGKKSQMTKKAQMDYDILANKIRAANAATAQGNTIMSTAVARLKSLAVAFGFFGTIYLVANAIKDSIKRIREFDKEMQNMAGVTRSSRAELKELEAMIKAVSGQSVMTSNDVAKLATSLLVLGKSKEEVMKLLKPANDLGIALNTTSEAAGEFLVKQLNSFGASADSAAEYADVIATIRTSTSMDFQNMVDSFQYLSPISRALGEDLAYTGSVIGILADNGLKAQQAGRLLGTAVQRLAKQEMTLADALNIVNEARNEGKTQLEVLAIASKLFGAQAGKVGVILANNTDLIQKNAQAIRENRGALDDLITNQMEAFDAKMKILDATWEEWLLSLQAGQGTMGTLFLGAIEGLTGFFNMLVDINKELWMFQEIGKAEGNVEMVKYLNTQMKELGITMEEAANIEFKNVEDKLDVISKKLYELNQRKQGFWGGTVTNFITDQNIKKWTEAQSKAIEFMNVIREARGELRELDQAIAAPMDTKSYEDVSKALEGSKDKVAELKAEWYKLNDEYEKAEDSGTLTQAMFDRINAVHFERVGVSELVVEYEKLLKTLKPDLGFSILDYNGEGNDIADIKDKIYWEKELKAAKEDHGATLKEDYGGRAAAKARIDLAEEELKLWELKNEEGEKSKIIMKGSVAALEEIKSNLEDQQKRIATNTEEWKEYESQIDSVSNRIEDLKRGIESVGKIEIAREKELAPEEDKNGNEYLTDQVNREKEMSAVMRSIKEADFTYLAHLENDELAREKELNDERLRMAKELGEEQYKAAVKFGEKELSDLEKVQSKRRDVVGESIQKMLDMEADAVQAKKEMQEGFADILSVVGDQILQRRIVEVDREIQENERLYAEKLDNENLSTEQRAAIEAERDRKEAELQEKRRKREKQNFLIQQGMALAGIAITLAQTIAAINLGGATMIAQGGLFAAVPAAAYVTAATSTAITSAALSAGMVLAQGISQYKTGRKGGEEEVAILGDGGKHEPILDKYGNLKGISPNKPTFMHLDKGDSVLPSTNHLSKDYQSILNATTMTTLSAASVSNDPDKLARIFDAKLSGLRSEMKSGIKEGFTGIKLPGNKDISKLANELKFNRKRDAL